MTVAPAVAPRHRVPCLRRSSWQIVNSLGPYLLLWATMIWTATWSIPLTLLLAVPAAGFLVRVFIIFHDCGHGSYYRSRSANDFWGRLTGLLLATPYQRWRHDHAVHHATSGDLDRRGIGDIWTLTVREYRALPRWRRACYRLVRNPAFLLLVVPLYLFAIQHRFPSRGSRWREVRSVMWTNLWLLVALVALVSAFGLGPVLWVQLSISAVAGTVGVWLFYVQHQFEDVYWSRSADWDYFDAAIAGSSYYRLPRMLQWFTGNIGFHHVHHLSPAVPNYNLERCHRDDSRLRRATTIGLRDSLRSLTFRLWDEDRGRLIGFGELRRMRAGGL